MKVGIVLGHQADLVLIGTQAVLDKHPHFQVHASLTSSRTLVSAARIYQPQVVILDERLDPEQDVLAVVEQVRSAAPTAKQMVTGSLKDGLLIRDLFACGVRGYLYEGDELQECLVQAVKTVMRERLYLSPTANAEYLVAMQSKERDWQLDSEARTVLRLLAQGCHVGQIAYQMKLSARRVYWVREKLRRRFGALTNEQMISRAAAEGFTYPG